MNKNLCKIAATGCAILLLGTTAVYALDMGCKSTVTEPVHVITTTASAGVQQISQPHNKALTNSAKDTKTTEITASEHISPLQGKTVAHNSHKVSKVLGLNHVKSLEKTTKQPELNKSTVSLGHTLAVLNNSNENVVAAKGLTFVAQVVNANNEVLAGHQVKLYDITESRFLAAVTTTDAKGLATFVNLGLQKNYSVEIDGVAQGYTFRNSEAKMMQRTFIVAGKSETSVKGQLASEPAIITVLSQDGKPVVNQEVTLIWQGKTLASALSDSEGKVHFNNLHVGVFYDLMLNGKTQLNFARAGEETSLFVNVESEAMQAEKKDSEAVSESVTFTTKVIDSNQALLSDQVVRLYDITYGRELVAENNTHDGQAVFNKLKVSHNYSVEINGESIGYTFRSSEENAQLSHTFILADVKGSDEHKIATITSTVSVFNEDGMALAGKKVDLFYRGQVVGHALTNQDGEAVIDGLVEGTFYDIHVDGQDVNNFVLGGDSQAVYVAK